MVQKVAVKDALEQLEASLLEKVDAKTKVTISEAVDPLKSEIHVLRSRVQKLEKPQPKEHGSGAGSNDPGLKRKSRNLKRNSLFLGLRIF